MVSTPSHVHKTKKAKKEAILCILSEQASKEEQEQEGEG